MKKNILFLMILSNLSVYAGEDCGLLSEHLGTYDLVSSYCDEGRGPFGSTFEVTEASESEGRLFWLSTGNIGLGFSVEENINRRCDVTNIGLVLQSCINEGCLPANWSYQFSNDFLSFGANGCHASYKRR